MGKSHHSIPSRSKNRKKSETFQTVKIMSGKGRKKRQLNQQNYKKLKGNEEFMKNKREYSRIYRKQSKDIEESRNSKISSMRNSIKFFKRKTHDSKEEGTRNHLRYELDLMELSEEEEKYQKISWFKDLENAVEIFEIRISDWHRLLGLEKIHFERVADGYASHYYAFTWDGKVRKNNSKIHTLSARTALLVTLNMFRQYSTGIQMQTIFNCHERTLSRVYERVELALHSYFRGAIHWPRDEDIMGLINPVDEGTPFEGILLIVDGTVISTFRSKLKFKAGMPDPYFSGAKKKTGENFLAFVDFTGRIWWNTKLYPGGTTDQKIWNLEKLRNWFSENDVGVMGDLGFTFNTKKEQYPIKAVSPFPYETRVGDSDDAKSNREFSREVSVRRVLVEHVFSRLKEWSIIGIRCRHFHPNAQKKGLYNDRLDLNFIVDILCCFHNIDIELHPMTK
jgi:DDE superfamily endonuclease